MLQQLKVAGIAIFIYSIVRWTNKNRNTKYVLFVNVVNNCLCITIINFQK